MEDTDLPAPAGPAIRRRVLCLAALLALFIWQAWLTLGLFGPDEPWARLLDDQPILSGAHPQHLYLGWIGAQSLWHSGRICVYDPAFQIGYPKTPIFNGGRLGEIFLFLSGGEYSPAAYKVGLAIVCLLVPALMVMASFGAGLRAGATLAATAIGLILWWGPSGRATLEAGGSELLLASLALLAHMGALVRYDRLPGCWPWLLMLLTACMGWFLQPLLFPIALPMLLVYYLSAGTRHGNLSWHLALLVAEAGGLAVNLPWLIDWVGYWWLRSPLPVDAGMLPHRTLFTLWNAPLWGGTLERGLAMFLLASALVGSILWNQNHQRPAARLFGLGALFLLVLALLGISWEPLGQWGTSVLLVPALWFAALPTAHAWTCLAGALCRSGGLGRAVLVAGIASVGIAAWGFPNITRLFVLRGLEAQPLEIGLGSKRQRIVEQIREHTGIDARVLWEDRLLARSQPRWSALLPILAGRAFVGGLDPDGTIEHSSISFVDQALEGRPISTWSDHALEAYCSRYNIGSAICWSPATIKRFREWEGALAVTELEDDVTGTLFVIKQAQRSYTSKGQAKLLHADTHHITLGDVVPEHGVVVLSVHYQAGLRATPNRVQVEREPSGHDPIGFIRLRVASPVARVTLSWGER